MTHDNSCDQLQPQMALADIPVGDAGITLALLGNYPDTDETRMLLTPEASGLLTSAGIKVYMETGAGVDVSFTDANYAEYGVRIVTREEALKMPIVLSYAPLRVEDIRKMTKGATLLCMMASELFDAEVIKCLLECQITLGCFDNMLSHNDEPVFANIIDEINGRAAVMYAQDFLSFTGGGKGVLLAGGIGINPCEVLLIGEGNDVCAAAKAARAAGAYVTIMNNDISALQLAKEVCGETVNCLAIHPKVLYNKVKSADVIFMAPCTRPFEFPKHLSVALKDSAFVLNFEETQPSISVPRTVAMAVSNVLVNFFDEMSLKGGIDSMLATTPGMQYGIVTYRGKLVDKLIGSYTSLPSVDITMMLSASN